jgi:hypothetical protein
MSVFADNARSDLARIPRFGVQGRATATWGATMALSKSDGSYVIVCNNVLPWWNPLDGSDVTPTAENWTISFAAASKYTVTDIKSGATTEPKIATTASVAVRGYPMMIHVWP